MPAIDVHLAIAALRACGVDDDGLCAWLGNLIG